MSRTPRRTRLALALACGLSAAAVSTAFAQQAPQPQGGQRGGATAMREVDIRAFIEDVSNATGRTFIVDPRVSGRVTVMAHQALSESELFDVFLSTLRVHGYVAVPTAQGAYRIVPDEVAAREPSPEGGPSADRYVSQVFRLRFADAESVASALRPMLSQRGQVTANARGNSVVVVDYGSTITRLRQIVSNLDQDTSSYRTLRLRNTSAAEMARVATSLSQASGDAQGRALVTATPIASSNTLVLRGDRRTLDQIIPLLTQLDSNADMQAGVKVIPLKYAVAEDLVPILQQISSSMTGPAEGAGGANRRANIAAHRATNALIISADRETQESLANVVQSLDIRRQQVMVEAIIVEVSDTAAKELGLQFIVSGNEDSAVPFLSTSFANSAPNLLAVTGALLGSTSNGNRDNPALQDLQRAAVSSLVNYNGALGGVAGQNGDGTMFGLILNALAEDQESNVLSTPKVMTLDNETASILVGQQIPVTTGETLSDSNTNPFRTVRREDVGVQLEVRPQVSEGGAIRLAIKQEVSSIFGQIIDDSTDLITNRRAIETVVQVDAGQIIVLGGLIQEDVQRSNSGIPVLRKLPLVGRLFSSEGRTRKRTNLMVFLRPSLVNTAEQAGAVTERQYELLRNRGGLDRSIDTQVQEMMRAPQAPPAPLPEPRAEAPRPQQRSQGEAAPVPIAPPQPRRADAEPFWRPASTPRSDSPLWTPTAESQRREAAMLARAPAVQEAAWRPQATAGEGGVTHAVATIEIARPERRPRQRVAPRLPQPPAESDDDLSQYGGWMPTTEQMRSEPRSELWAPTRQTASAGR
ncbi:MAG: type II secretion system secretin GspD [Hyphomonadaceae bacterium]|nr:type II secretion system secretin GspD [Hyphomonadaceae bacterium]